MATSAHGTTWKSIGLSKSPSIPNGNVLHGAQPVQVKGEPVTNQVPPPSGTL